MGLIDPNNAVCCYMCLSVSFLSAWVFARVRNLTLADVSIPVSWMRKWGPAGKWLSHESVAKKWSLHSHPAPADSGTGICGLPPCRQGRLRFISQRARPYEARSLDRKAKWGWGGILRQFHLEDSAGSCLPTQEGSSLASPCRWTQRSQAWPAEPTWAGSLLPGAGGCSEPAPAVWKPALPAPGGEGHSAQLDRRAGKHPWSPP